MPIAKAEKPGFQGLAATLRLTRSTEQFHQATMTDGGKAGGDIGGDVGGDQAARREALAEFCRSFDARLAGDRGAKNDSSAALSIVDVKLSRRLRQTLHRLLAGDSEKQIATRLQVSKHTVHVYVKSLYKQFTVNSRGELLARFVQMPADAD